MALLADNMLGRLAKWLRVMGYDVHYQTQYRPLQIDTLVKEGRLLLSRKRKIFDLYPGAVFIASNHVREQLLELKRERHLGSEPPEWFTRCLVCNVPLVKAGPSTARENVPEYIFHENPDGIRQCPSCRRFFWPGTHRQRMVRLLNEWGWTIPQKERA